MLCSLQKNMCHITFSRLASVWLTIVWWKPHFRCSILFWQSLHWARHKIRNTFCEKKPSGNLKYEMIATNKLDQSNILYLFLIEPILNLVEPFVKSLNLGCRIFPSLKFNVNIWLQLFGMQTIVEINHPSARHQTWRNSPLHWPQNVWWFSPGWQTLSSTITVER